MTRFDITRILAPTAIKPRTSGPRDDLPRQLASHVTMSPATPAKSSHNHNHPISITIMEPDMITYDTQSKVLAALTKKSPLTAAELRAATGLDSTQISNAIYNLKQKFAVSGFRGDYKLINGHAAKAPPPKAKAIKPATTKQSTTIPCGPAAGTTFAERLAAAQKPILRFTADQLTVALGPAEKPRVITTADGGCIILTGTLVTAELNKEQFDAVVSAI